jgi:hypothetical protein
VRGPVLLLAPLRRPSWPACGQGAYESVLTAPVCPARASAAVEVEGEEDEQAVRPMRASTARDSRRMSRTVGTAGGFYLSGPMTAL